MTKELAYRIPMRAITLDDVGHGVQTWKTGELAGISTRYIQSVLSMNPIESFPQNDKVLKEWIFEVGGPDSFTGFVMHIWDWKGSSGQGRWSTYGPHAYFEIMFGEHYTPVDTTLGFKARDSILNR
jgi:hypothetical protein